MLLMYAEQLEELITATHRLAVQRLLIKKITDLGTTNSCVVFMKSKMPKLIGNAKGASITPSVVPS